jgi:hypothetical protein
MLCADYDLPYPACDAAHIHLITGAEMYLLQPHGSKPRTHFGLTLPLDVLGFS